MIDVEALKLCHKSSLDISPHFRVSLIWSGPPNTKLQEVMVK